MILSPLVFPAAAKLELLLDKLDTQVQSPLGGHWYSDTSPFSIPCIEDSDSLDSGTLDSVTLIYTLWIQSLVIRSLRLLYYG